MSNDNWFRLYLSQSKALTAYAARLTGSRDEAADIMQEVFLLFSPKDAGQPTPPKSYLYSMVRNLVHNRRRHAGVHNAMHPDDFPWWARHEAVQTPEEQLLVLDQARVAARAIEALDPLPRQVVELYRFDGFTLQEIADRVGISLSTAHRLLKEGMNEIRKSIRPD